MFRARELHLQVLAPGQMWGVVVDFSGAGRQVRLIFSSTSRSLQPELSLVGPGRGGRGVAVLASDQGKVWQSVRGCVPGCRFFLHRRELGVMARSTGQKGESEPHSGSERGRRAQRSEHLDGAGQLEGHHRDRLELDSARALEERAG